MKDLIILGTEVHSMEMADIVGRVNASRSTHNLLGYLTSRPEEVGKMLNEFPVVGTVDDLGRFPSAMLVPNNEWPRPIDIPRERFTSLIDPSAFVARTAKIGAGCVVYPGCYIGHEAVIGDFVFSLSGSIINHECIIDEYCVFASGVTVAGSVCLGKSVYMGQSSTVRQKLRIGHDSLVGMGSVVVKDVEPGSVMAGNPARRIRQNLKES